MSFTIEDMILTAEERYEMKFCRKKWLGKFNQLGASSGRYHDHTELLGKGTRSDNRAWLSTKEDWMNLARLLNKYHASGLIINVGQYIYEVPEELKAYCDENDLPLLTVPWEVHLSDMIKDFSIHVFLQDNTDEQIASALIAAIETPENQKVYRKELLQHFDVDGSFQVFFAYLRRPRFYGYGREKEAVLSNTGIS